MGSRSFIFAIGLLLRRCLRSECRRSGCELDVEEESGMWSERGKKLLRGKRRCPETYEEGTRVSHVTDMRVGSHPGGVL
jgi:hypothetical protein